MSSLSVTEPTLPLHCTFFKGLVFTKFEMLKIKTPHVEAFKKMQILLSCRKRLEKMIPNKTRDGESTA